MQQHRAGNHQQAQVLYGEILQDNPENDMALYYFGIMAFELGHYETAIENLKKAILINPVYEYYKDLGNIYFDLDRKQEAIQSFDKALLINGNDVDVWFNLGLLYQQIKDMGKAVLSFENVIRLNNNDLEAYNHLGSIYYNELKDSNKAIEYFNKAVALNPELGYFNLA
ncbi:MAG TPA: hypothetical protein DDX14_07750, partial [Cyanobacteria bacterium UBA9579]|nr:hypothetical protein [Cyanobacteria bacterium UBA9579]